MYTPYTHTQKKKKVSTVSFYCALAKKTQLTLTGHTKPTSGHQRDD